MSREEQKNNHLNLFHFYGEKGNQFLEDNLTRGLAICLKNDPILLDRFLRTIMKGYYDDLFKTEGEKTNLIINVQQRAGTFEGIQTVFGVPLTTQELDFETEISPKGVDSPITDLSIQIGDQLILIEVKRTAEDCRKQLQNQIDVVSKANDENVNVEDVGTFSWGVLMDLIRHTLKFENEVSHRSIFTSDYYDFIKRQFPSWFANIPFREISFPDNIEESPKEKELLEVRLNLIKQEILNIWNKKSNVDDELVFNRANIPVHDYNWVDEINIEPSIDKVTSEKFISLKVWPGDTKTQGYSIYKKGKTFEWPPYIFNKKYKFRIQPYLKFSHMQGLCWVNTKDKTNPKTHTKEFFDRFTGKWKRDKQKGWIKNKASWDKFDQILEEVNDSEHDWKTASKFNSRIEESQRSYFYVSIGFAVEVRMPYGIARELDINGDDNPIVEELKKIAETLLEKLNDQFAGL
ncbi:hypothetical protein DYD21_16775 [Rhodohalobacter sp. SW132]|uniref:hypothetical protein n=1 Tax=Rhodohalobacter sp. SW132 TaxID=2293433 RepID=UPI000E27CFDB|nr:hypothetical protein [Rhodohalobacter sp. SW132]REL24814.1 hypothetical protein DYD21_16775 [Rhodohalobacter sp. SW132]